MAGNEADQGTDTLDVDTGATAILGLLSDDLDTEGAEQVAGSEVDDDTEEEEDAVSEGADDEDSDGENADEDEEADAGPDDEVEDDGEGEDGEEAEDSPATYKVKVDGKEFDVTLDEALAGYQRQQAFTKRMQAVAEDKRALSERAAEAAQARQEYLDRLDLVEKALTGADTEPNWEQLKAQDPSKYAETRIAWQERREQLEQLRAEQTRVRDEQHGAMEAERQRVLMAEAEKLDAAIPDWAADPDVKRDGQQKIVQFAQATYGFTPDDLGSIVDHRVILLLRDAMAYNEMRQKGTKAKDVAREKRRKSPTLQPGSPRAAKAKVKSGKNSARKKLAQTGRVDDAVSVLLDLLPD